MLSPRWTKLARDLWLGRGRAALMIVAIAAGNAGLGAILASYAPVSSAMESNYLGTNPASATIELDAVDDALVAEARRRPGVADAEARSSIVARVRVAPDTWRPLLLFVVPDFDAARIAVVRPVAGARTPPAGTMLVERSGLGMLGAGLGESAVVKTPSGEAREVAITGVVHDPSLAPAWQERGGYGYVTPETARLLGASGALDELNLVVADPKADSDAIEATARDVAAWLASEGHAVREIRVPPPRRHPHQAQMKSVMIMLLLFAALALVLGAILVATTIGGLMAEQVRQIGVMKAVGARTAQIVVLYLVYVLAVSLVALAIAVPAGALAGRALSERVADLLNLELAAPRVVWWVVGVQALAGLLIPLALSIGPILRGADVTVREALGDFGVDARSTGSRVDRLLSRVRGLDRVSLLAMRNALRRKRRLALDLTLLAAAGAMFMAGLDVSAAWQRNIEEGLARRHYDAEVRFDRAEPAAPLIERIRAVPGVATVEAWGAVPAAAYRPGEVEVSHTYPDRGHGSFALRGVPATSKLVDFPVGDGRWLQPGDTDAVVLNTSAAWIFPDARVGDEVTIAADGKPTTWRVVGFVSESMSSATAYVTDEAFARALGEEGTTRSLRIVAAGADDGARAETIRGVERSLAESGAHVSGAIADSELREVMIGHIRVLVFALLALAGLMAIVGGVGLAATLSASVVERTRELGVLRTIGATPATVVRAIVTEGLFVGALSWVVAIVAAVPLSLVVGAHVGALTFNTPLPRVVTPAAPFVWLAIALAVSVVSSALPAWRASRLTVREALGHV